MSSAKDDAEADRAARTARALDLADQLDQALEEARTASKELRESIRTRADD